MKTPVVVLRRNWLQLLTYVLVLLASLTVVFFAGYYKSEYDIHAILDGELSAVDKMLAQADEINQLTKEKLHFEHDREIEKQASLLLEQQFSGLNQEIDLLKKDLALYKSIVDPSNKDSGVYLKKLKIYPLKSAADQKVFHYQIILAQKSKQRAYTRGTVEMVFISEQKDSKKGIVVFDKKNKALKPKKYKFRYYQDIQGQIKIAADVLIKQVKVIVKHSKQKYENIEYVIDWSDSKETIYVGK